MRNYSTNTLVLQCTGTRWGKNCVIQICDVRYCHKVFMFIYDLFVLEDVYPYYYNHTPYPCCKTKRHAPHYPL